MVIIYNIKINIIYVSLYFLNWFQKWYCFYVYIFIIFKLGWEHKKSSLVLNRKILFLFNYTKYFKC